MMKVPFVDLSPTHDELSKDITNVFKKVMEEQNFILGDYCNVFEENFAKYCGAKYCCSCGNGLDAITLILRGYGIEPGDEVIVPSHTFIATALAVNYAGATPIFVDVDEEYLIDIEDVKRKITKKTKAVIAVHLYGNPVNFDELKKAVNGTNIKLIEDAAQAHGAKYKDIKAGNLGDAAGFSFYPGKNLGAIGDAGAITTNDKNLYEKIITLRNYGAKIKYNHEEKGVNSRMDELQAAILNLKLEHLDKYNLHRNKIAKTYMEKINNPLIKLPNISKGKYSVYHIFAVLADNPKHFQKYMQDNGIMTLNHYPTPIHLQKAYCERGHKVGDFPVSENVASHEVSIPMYYGMSDEQVDYVADIINKYTL